MDAAEEILRASRDTAQKLLELAALGDGDGMVATLLPLSSGVLSQACLIMAGAVESLTMVVADQNPEIRRYMIDLVQGRL